MNKLLFWAVWMLGVVVSHSAATTNDAVVENIIIGEEATVELEQQQQQQQQQQQRSREITDVVTTIESTTTGAYPTLTITTNFSTTSVDPQQQLPELPPPCGCQQTLTRVVCSASTIQYETYILARLSSLANVPTSSALSADMIDLLQDNMVNAYNELQNLHHCDRPYFREMQSAELMLDNDGSSTSSLDELYLNFKVVITSHLDSDGNGPPQPIALDGTPHNADDFDRLLQQQQDETSSSSSLPPLIRHLRQLQTDVGGDCTCPTALAASTTDTSGSFTSESQLQVEYNERLLNLFGPGRSSTSTSNSIDEMLQLTPVEDLDVGVQCNPRSTGISFSVVTPMQASTSAYMFETVFIMHVQVQPDWQYDPEAPTEEQAKVVQDLVEMQMRLLQDSYNDEDFRNCDSYFRRIISTMPILVEDTNTTVRRKRQRHLQLQQTLLAQLEQQQQGDDADGGDDDNVVDDASLLLIMGNHSSVDDDSKQQEQQKSSSSRLLFQHIHNDNTDLYNNMAMLAVRATVECLNDNCPADKKALANSAAASQRERQVMTRALLQQKEEEGIVAAAGLRGNVVGSAAANKDAAAAHHDDDDGRHLLWSDVMAGCYCPAYLEGTGNAPTNETLMNAMNKNMQLIESPSASLVELVTAIYEVEIHDCSQPRTEFETVVSAIMVGDPNLVTSSELTALGDGFESTYNSIAFQTCDPLFRSIDAVEVFIPPQEDPIRRRQRLLLKNGGLQNNSSSTDDKDNEQRMLQTKTKKPFTSGYAVRGTCVGLCPDEDTLFKGGFGTRQRERRDATTAAATNNADDDGVAEGKRVPTEQELRSYIQSSPAFFSPFAAFQRGLQQQLHEGDQCACATGSLADDVYTGPTVELMNVAYSLKVEELKAQGDLINVDSVEITQFPLLCKCKTPVPTSCALPIDPVTVDGIIMLNTDEYPCNLDCEEFDEIFGRRRRRQRDLHVITCDRGIFVCPSDEL